MSAVVPSVGPAAGGTSAQVFGDNFLAGATETFCGTPATNVTLVSSSKITCTTTPHAAGPCDVRDASPNGQDGVLPSGFTYP